MRIVLSNSSYHWGGVNKVTEILTRGLQSRGHEVVIFGYPGRTLEERMEGIAPFEPILKGMDFHPVVLFNVAAALKRTRPDVVLALMRKDMTMTAPVARVRGIPVIVRHPNQRPLGNNRYWQLLYGDFPSLHITNAEATKRTVLESGPWIRPDQVKVIYNGIDAESYGKTAPATLDLPPNALAVGYVGIFDARKGLRELSQAWHEIAAAIPEAHLVLVGKGSLETQMRSDLSSAPRVHWLGYREDVAGVLRSLDLLVLPSYVEGAPNIVLEAMSAGTPVVATAVSGTPELVRDGIEARLVPPRDEKALASAIIELLRDPALRRNLSQAANVRVRDRFGLVKMIDAYEETLQLTVERSRPRH